MPRSAVLVQFFATITVAAVLHWLIGLVTQTQSYGPSSNNCPVSTPDNKTRFFVTGVQKFCSGLQRLVMSAANLTEDATNNKGSDIASLKAYVATQNATFAPYCERLGITWP